MSRWFSGIPFHKVGEDVNQNIDKDPVRTSLATVVIIFANETSTKVIAEGIETTQELYTPKDLGIRFGQG